MPFDGVRTAVAAGGGILNCYGLANSVECYMDGAFLKVDWLIMDLEGEFEFLLSSRLAVLALEQAHSPKKLVGLNSTAQIRLERSS